MNDMDTTVKKLFKALAFANVSTLDEFRTLLHQIDEPKISVSEPAQHGTIAQASANAPVIGHIQGAL